MKRKTKPASASKSPQTVADIKPSPYNPRTISDTQLETLGRSMKEHGDLSGVVFNVRTGNTIGGHQRIKELDPKWPVVKVPAKDATGTVATGYIDTPYGRFSYREVDWPEVKEKLANLAANRVGGEFDYEQVSKIVNDIASKADLSLTGFEEGELQSMLAQIDAAVEDHSNELRAKFEVVVECADEAEQREVYDALNKEGRKCRLLSM